ncbi:hypothetical protein CVT26_009174 [Gymnopilus dilepis]|uniref:Uncharacterized protein n=1 Tax=Gymnopilus dilepis TaxID=231916 RepID=A0A409Y9U4_9AGAR|nr:hypothetical protein CVT26_009174 [Gymnopilus dilepis]
MAARGCHPHLMHFFRTYATSSPPRPLLVLFSSSHVSICAHDLVMVGGCTLPDAACDVTAASAAVFCIAKPEGLHHP